MNQKIEKIKKSPIVAVMRNIPEKKTLFVIEALLKGGVRNIEIAYGNTSPSALIKEVKKQFKEELLIGAGTVLTTEQAKEVIDVGAEFIFSPVFDIEVVKETVKQNVISIPGCFSPTEIYEAYKAGAHIVKVFPANTLGPKFIKDIKAPMPFLNIIPTGGINKDNIASYLQAGAIAVGMGNSLLDKKFIEADNYEELTANAKELNAIIRS